MIFLDILNFMHNDAYV